MVPLSISPAAPVVLSVPAAAGHDVNDYEIGKRCGLEIINIMNNDGSLNAAAGAYAGMDRFEGEAGW